MQATKGVWLVLGLAFSQPLFALSLEERVSKAFDTANSLSNPENACSASAEYPLRNPGFYWEIGDVNGAFVGASGTVGPNALGWPKRSVPGMYIASASKWLYAAYFAERYGATSLTGRDFQFLTLSSGYHSLQSRPDTQCDSSQGVNFTVDDCVDLCSTNGTCNADFTLEDAGLFYYDSAHYETRASSLNMVDNPLTALHRPALGAYTATGTNPLWQELQPYIDAGPQWMDFSRPVLAEGIVTTPGAYIDHFLRKILSNSLQMSLLLGSGAVCTNTNLDANNIRICPTAVFEPIALRDSGESWHYSVGHWVEDDPNVGDGAFSSGGARGFYPWIRKARPGDNYGGWTTPIYGIVARDDPGSGWDPNSLDTPDAAIGWPSVLCGRAIRKAFLTGVAQ
jgi:hypothetical protein